jgi:hypothetical protein
MKRTKSKRTTFIQQKRQMSETNQVPFEDPNDGLDEEILALVMGRGDVDVSCW